MELKQLRRLTFLAAVITFGFGKSVIGQVKIPMADVPEPVRIVLETKYRKYTIDDVVVNNLKTEYQVELEKGSRTVSLVLATDGTVLSKTKGRIYSYDGTEKPPNDGTPHNQGDGHKH